MIGISQSQKGKLKDKLKRDIDAWTGFRVIDGPQTTTLTEAFVEANTPQQSELNFIVRPYLMAGDGLTATPFKDGRYTIGVAVRQLGYVSADDQIFNVWGYITRGEERTGLALYEGGEFRYGTLVYMLYDAAARTGVLLQLRRKAHYVKDALQIESIDLQLPIVPSMCPGARGDILEECAVYHMAPLSFPIGYSNTFDSRAYIREQIEEELQQRDRARTEPTAADADTASATEPQEAGVSTESTEATQDEEIPENLTSEEMEALLGNQSESTETEADAEIGHLSLENTDFLGS